MNWDHIWRGWEEWQMALFDFLMAVLLVMGILALVLAALALPCATGQVCP